MRILALTDFHGHAPSFEKAAKKAAEKDVEAIAIAGDITHFGGLKTAKRLLNLLTATGAIIFFVPGNCDPPSLAYVDWEPMVNLYGRSVNMEDFTFIGVGGSLLGPFRSLFEMTEEGISVVLKRGFGRENDKKPVLVTHNPPRNTKVDLAYLGRHVGSVSIRRFIEREKPICVICGHIHEAPGIDKIGETTIVNPGPARMGLCALIELSDRVRVTPELL